MRCLACLVAACALTSGTAAAATRYVSPSGTDSGRCPRSAPCSVAFAVNGSGSRAGDTVVVLDGTYTDQPLALHRPLTITGPEAAARPVFRATQAGGTAVSV